MIIVSARGGSEATPWKIGLNTKMLTIMKRSKYPKTRVLGTGLQWNYNVYGSVLDCKALCISSKYNDVH